MAEAKTESKAESKASDEPQMMPTEPEAPLPKDVPDSEDGRRALMSSENAEGHATARVDDDERSARAQRAHMMAQEGKGIMVSDEQWQKAV